MPLAYPDGNWGMKGLKARKLFVRKKYNYVYYTVKCVLLSVKNTSNVSAVLLPADEAYGSPNWIRERSRKEGKRIRKEKKGEGWGMELHG